MSKDESDAHDERPRARLADSWPRLAFLAITVATGVGMTFLALRGRNALARTGADDAALRLVTVGVPALLGAAILAFATALLSDFVARRRRLDGAREETVSHRGNMVRLTVFVVPVMVLTQIAAAKLGNAEETRLATFVMAGLLPLVPLVLIGFGVVILTASSVFAAGERSSSHHGPERRA
jgi:hypothetical protein